MKFEENQACNCHRLEGLDELTEAINNLANKKKINSNKGSGFKIRISDSYVAFEYSLMLSDNYSISQIYEKICDCFNLSRGRHDGKRIDWEEEC